MAFIKLSTCSFSQVVYSCSVTNPKPKGRGGYRKGSGRKKTGTIRKRYTVKASTDAKIERMRKAGQLWKRPGQIIDEVIKAAPFEQEREIYKLAGEIQG